MSQITQQWENCWKWENDKQAAKFNFFFGLKKF
jgi:hypothetical protein